MVEFAAGGTGHNEHYGDCRNPWDTERATGGSSSGSGCAVAARMVFGSLGSDTGGSVRMPAALCGVTGLKPSDGRVSRYGVMPRSWTTDTLGPMARSAHDVARLLGVVAGHDTRATPRLARRRCPTTRRRSRTVSTACASECRVKAGSSTPERKCRKCSKRYAVASRASGAGSAAWTYPTRSLHSIWPRVIVKSEAASLHERWLRERPGDYSIAIRAPIEAGLFIAATHYLHAQRLRGPMLEAFNRAVFDKVDALLLPAVPFPAPSLADCDPNSTTGAARTMAEFPRFTRPISYLGLPALVLPGGFSSANLPIGFQIVAPPFAESLLLRLGHHYQRETDWYPPATFNRVTEPSGRVEPVELSRAAIPLHTPCLTRLGSFTSLETFAWEFHDPIGATVTRATPTSHAKGGGCRPLRAPRSPPGWPSGDQRRPCGGGLGWEAGLQRGRRRMGGWIATRAVAAAHHRV